MEDTDPLRRYLEAGLALTQLTRARAEALVKELVKAGDLHREHTQERVEELLDRSRKTTDGLAGVIRKEMTQQLLSMGFATKEDLENLEARMEGRFAAMGATGGKKAPPTTATAKAAPGAKASKAAPGRRAAKAQAAKPEAAAPAAKASPAKAAKTAGASRPSKAASAQPGTAARKVAAKRPGRRGPGSGPSPAAS